jgi:formylglycine-generating enzyme
VDFTGADLTSANLEGAKVHNATLDKTILNGADFRGVRGLKASDLTRAADLIIMDERQMKALSILQERERQALSPQAPSQASLGAASNTHDRHYAGHTKTHTAQLHEGYLSRVTPSARVEPEGSSEQRPPLESSAHLPPEVASQEERAHIDERERRRAEKLARYQQRHQLRGEVSFQLNLIPEGRFVMGTERPDHEESASPRYEVKISKPFFLLTTPVTQALYLKVMDEARFKFPHPEHPAENVSWYDALEFCNRLSKLEGLEPAYQVSLKGVHWSRSANGYRLPTEAEWEHAARAHNTHPYAGGDEVESLAWCSLNASSSTHPVAQKAPNAWGLYDMSGNVWEWCYDLFKEGVYQKRASKSLERPFEDPVEEGHEGPRLIRGGSWSLEPEGVELSHRSRLAPHFKTSRIGFRVARSPHMR